MPSCCSLSSTNTPLTLYLHKKHYNYNGNKPSLRSLAMRASAQKEDMYEENPRKSLDKGVPYPIPSHSSSSSNNNNNKKSIWAHMGQRLNTGALLLTLKVLLKDTHLALPHLSADNVSCVDWLALKRLGFQAVVFDKDNTLTAPYSLALWPSLAQGVEDCKVAFQGRIAILSNSAGLKQYDPDGVEAKLLEDTLGIPVICHGSKKPAGSAHDVQKHFGCELSSVVMVGDRIFTDIVYGNRNGLFTIYTKPLTLQGEPVIVRQVRKMESALLRRWQRKGLRPNSHPLFNHNTQCIKDPKQT